MSEEIRTILAPVDGSDTSMFALKKAIRIAKNNQARLIIAHSLAFTFDNISESSYMYGLKEDMVKQAKNLLNEAYQIAMDEGLTDVKKILTDGPHKETISKRLVEDHSVDLIIIGSTGQNALEKFLLGSTTEYVIRYAKCDVMVVRPENI